MTITFSPVYECLTQTATVSSTPLNRRARDAKNVISVGASENNREGHYECDTHLTYTNCAAQGNQNTIFTYGAAWPTDYPANRSRTIQARATRIRWRRSAAAVPASDGRIKPDVVAPGTWVLSDTPTSLYSSTTRRPTLRTTPTSTTGGAIHESVLQVHGRHVHVEPLVAGGAAVDREFYQKTHSVNASAALVKATIVNSAVDLLDENNDGVNDNANPIPNRHEGWGRVDLNSATDSQRKFVDEATALTTGATATYSYTIPLETESPFR
jgi:hypothetical protein